MLLFAAKDLQASQPMADPEGGAHGWAPFLLVTFLCGLSKKSNSREARKRLMSSQTKAYVHGFPRLRGNEERWVPAVRGNGGNHSPNVNNDALPPAAVVLIVTVFSVAKRGT